MDRELSLDSIVQRVTQAVLLECAKQGYTVASPAPRLGNGDALGPNVEKIDMSGYRTPLVTERTIRKLHELTGAIMLPKGTVLTPMAKEAIREKNIRLLYE